jgi:hypothetical protein
MDIQTAQAQHPEAFAAIERRMAEWSDDIDGNPQAIPVSARLVDDAGLTVLEIVADTPYSLVAFRAPLNPSAVVH